MHVGRLRASHRCGASDSSIAWHETGSGGNNGPAIYRHFRAVAKRRAGRSARYRRRGSTTSITSRAYRRYCRSFPGLTKEQLPDGQGWAIERVQLTTHNGTHLDAPWHYHPTMNEGQHAWTIDEVPLEWCFQPGVKLDFRRFADGYVATAAEVEEELRRDRAYPEATRNCRCQLKRGGEIRPARLCRVGLRDGRRGHTLSFGTGVRLTGTDAWSWDAPFVHTASAMPRPTTPRSSGKATKPAATSAIATSRSCTI